MPRSYRPSSGESWETGYPSVGHYLNLKKRKLEILTEKRRLEASAYRGTASYDDKIKFASLESEEEVVNKLIEKYETERREWLERRL